MVYEMWDCIRLMMWCQCFCIILVYLCCACDGASLYYQHGNNRVAGPHHKHNLDDLIQYFQPHNSFHNSVIGRLECFTCKSVVHVLQQTLRKHEAKFADIADSICKVGKVEEAAVCDGIISVFKDEAITVLEQLVLDPEEICGLILGPDCSVYYDPYGMWNITIPPPPPPPPHEDTHRDQSGHETRPLRVLHISDLHIDLKYTEGSRVDCGRPVCCRKTSGTPGASDKLAGRWGSLAQCDLPYRTAENLFTHLNTSDTFDYVIWTGDLPSHADWDQDRGNQLTLLKDLQVLFQKYLPSTPVYWSLGNHEGVPVNGFPPPYIHGNQSMGWLYTPLVDWSPWLPVDTQQTILRGGYYTVLVSAGHRLVSLNMNYCNNRNWWMLLNTTDPAGQLEWLVQVLLTAETKQELVHIIGHIPPGKGDCLKAWSWNFYSIVRNIIREIRKLGLPYGQSVRC